MAIDFKPNFFTGGSAPATSAPPVPQTQVLQIAWANDPKFRAKFGEWLYENYSILVAEYKKHGRFLSLKEITDNPLD